MACWHGPTPTGTAELVRTAVHAAFGMLNAVGTFQSPLADRELAAQLGPLAEAAMQIDRRRRRLNSAPRAGRCDLVLGELRDDPEAQLA